MVLAQAELHQSLLCCQWQRARLGRRHVNVCNHHFERHLPGLSGCCLCRQLDSAGAGTDGAHRTRRNDLVHRTVVPSRHQALHLRVFRTPFRCRGPLLQFAGLRLGAFCQDGNHSLSDGHGHGHLYGLGYHLHYCIHRHRHHPAHLSGRNGSYHLDGRGARIPAYSWWRAHDRHPILDYRWRSCNHLPGGRCPWPCPGR